MPTLIYDPTVDDKLDEAGVALAPRLTSLDGLRIGLLSNSKAKADMLLREVANVFAERHGCEVVVEQSKRTASRPATPEVLQQIARADVDFMVTAVGD